jgi:hypothetical protein
MVFLGLSVLEIVAKSCIDDFLADHGQLDVQNAFHGGHIFRSFRDIVAR